MADGQHDLRNAAITLGVVYACGFNLRRSCYVGVLCVGPPFLFELCRRGFGDGTLADWLSADRRQTDAPK